MTRNLGAVPATVNGLPLSFIDMSLCRGALYVAGLDDGRSISEDLNMRKVGDKRPSE
jgi:hypothetical protein